MFHLPHRDVAEAVIPVAAPGDQRPVNRVWLGLAAACAIVLLGLGLSGHLSAGWGFALLVFGGLSLGLAAALFCLLVFSHRGDTGVLAKGSKAVCAFLFFFSAAARLAGTVTVFGAGFFGARSIFTPWSFNATAFLM